MAKEPYNLERVFTSLAGYFLSMCMNATGTAKIVLSTVQSIPTGGHLCGTTALVVQGSFLKALVQVGAVPVTQTTLYWTGTGTS
jgi:hypothetical protein